MYWFFICFWKKPLFGGTAPPLVLERAGLRTAVQIHALSLGFLRIVLKHLPGLHRKAQLSHITHVDLERCISPPSAFSVEIQRKEKTVQLPTPLLISPSLLFFNSFLFLSKWMLLCCFSPSSLVNGCSFMWDVRAGKPIECSVYIKSHSFHDYNLELFGFDCSSSPKSVVYLFCHLL